MAWFCIVALQFGWRRGLVSAVGGIVGHRFDHDRLIYWAAVMALIGLWGNWEIRNLPAEMTSGQWSGLPVAYLFFATVLTYSYALSANLWLRSRTKTALLVLAITCFIYFPLIIFSARRQPTAEFVLIPAVALWFVKRKNLPRIVPLLAVIGMLLFLPSTGDYRGAASAAEHQNGWERVRGIRFLKNLRMTMQSGGPELTNAAMKIEAVDQTHEFDLGASFWNALIAQYVPRQIVGQEFKDSLMMPVSSPEYQYLGYVPPTGTTWTGFATAFASFWYFGCLVFFIIAWAMALLYRRALGGDLVAQLLYAVMLVQTAMIVTHSTVEFVVSWPHIAIFLLPGLYWARKPARLPRKEWFAFPVGPLRSSRR
jgi:hypothetical protein